MIQLNYRYKIEEDNEIYNGSHLFDPDEYINDPSNNDWNIIENLLEEEYYGMNATIKLLEVNRD